MIGNQVTRSRHAADPGSLGQQSSYLNTLMIIDKKKHEPLYYYV